MITLIILLCLPAAIRYTITRCFVHLSSIISWSSINLTDVLVGVELSNVYSPGDEGIDLGLMISHEVEILFLCCSTPEKQVWGTDHSNPAILQCSVICNYDFIGVCIDNIHVGKDHPVSLLIWEKLVRVYADLVLLLRDVDIDKAFH